MSHLKQTSEYTSFETISSAGAARAAILTVNNIEIKTPNFFPVLSFYGGGTSSSVYGGGIHRTIKEFMIGDDAIGGGNYSRYFAGTMTSIAALTDYGINKQRFEDYTSNPIKDQAVFSAYEGVIFIDSGGFKFLKKGGLDGSDFEIEIDQKEAFRIQKQLGGDIIVNLDHPISPDDSYEERQEKTKKTATNAVEFARLSQRYKGAKYLTIHGYNYSMLERFLDEVQEQFGNIDLSNVFDGVAMGSLVPKKDDRETLVTAVSDAVTLLDERGLGNLPIHVFGIGSYSMPLLIAVGADTFDSTTYLQNAINGQYSLSLSEYIPLEEVDFTKCDCPVCSDPELVNRMQGNAKYQKDILGPVAMHNLINHKQEIKKIRSNIKKEGTQALIGYLDKTVGRNDATRRQTHRVVNESLGGYF